jgi:hypothetical protein
MLCYVGRTSCNSNVPRSASAAGGTCSPVLQYDYSSLLLNVSSMVRRPIPKPDAEDEAAYQVRCPNGVVGTMTAH